MLVWLNWRRVLLLLGLAALACKLSRVLLCEDYRRLIVDNRLFFERKFLLSMMPDAAIDRFPILQRLADSQIESGEKKNQ